MSLISIFYLYIFSINIFCFILMWYDKRQSIKRRWRIKESTFFIYSIFGGSVGSLLGMYTFRHKTKHLSFKLGIPSILIIQILILVYCK